MTYDIFVSPIFLKNKNIKGKIFQSDSVLQAKETEIR